MARERVSPEGEALIEEIPSEFAELRHLVFVTYRDFPEVADRDFFQNRIRGFVREIQEGSNPNRPGREGRTEDEIASDFWNNQLPRLKEMEGIADRRVGTSDAGGGVSTKEGTTAGRENQAEEGVGGGGSDPETQLTILTGEDMNWYFDRNSGKWYTGYGLPNSNRELIFEAEPDQMDALFGDNQRPVDFSRKTFSALTQREGTSFAGNIAEMEGTGSFEDEYDKVISLALDEGSLPEWMEGNQKALDALFVAQSENKSNEWLMEQWSKLETFQNRFPNIDKMQKEGNLNLEEAVTNFLQYEANLRQTAAAFGQDVESITPDVVGGLIDGGYSVKAAQDVFKAYDRMEENSAAMEAFNQVLEANGMDPISDLQGMFDFVQGNAPDEYYDLYEASSLQEAATAAGLGDVFEAEDAIDAALRGEHTLDTAHKSMQQAAKLLLRMRNEVDTNKFGLETDELIDLSLGQAPSSGRSQAEIQEAINRATLTARASLQGRAKPFTGFTQSGTPQKRSLSNLRQQS